MVRGLELRRAAAEAEVEVQGCSVRDSVFLYCSCDVEGSGAVCEALLVRVYAGAVVDALGDVIDGLGVVDVDCLFGGVGDVDV